MKDVIVNLIWGALTVIIGIPLLLIALGIAVFGIVFGEFSILVARIILIVIIGKLLWNFVFD